MPDATGRCWFETFDVSATNDVWKYMVARLKDPTGTQWHGFYGQFTVPQNYVGTALIKPSWTSSATSGNCQFRFTYRAVGGDDAESLDQTSNQEQVSPSVDVAPSAAFERNKPTITLTSANLAAGDTVQFLFERGDPNGSTDTMAADATIHDLIFSYSDA
jgi:hypothetical protein